MFQHGLKLFIALIFQFIIYQISLYYFSRMNSQTLPKPCLQALEQISALLTPQNSTRPQSNLTPSTISQIFKPFSQMGYSAEIESLRGYCLQSIRKYELALYVYDEVLTRFPTHISTLRRKAQVLEKIGKNGQSEQIYKLAALLEPDNLYLQILRKKDDGASQESDSQKEEEESNDNKKWKIKIKSIDGEVRKIKSSKSVLFKKQILQEEHAKSSQTLSLKPKKSILKTKSQQHFLTQSQTKSVETEQNFDVKKIRSIDGKISLSSNHQKQEKQILFAIEDAKSGGSTQVSVQSGLRRKSSLGVSKIGNHK